MKLIESKAEYIPQEEGLEGVYKQVELAGRTAYHSLDKITPTSAKDFVDRMIKSKHGACLEHGTIYLYSQYGHHIGDYKYNPYSIIDWRYPTHVEATKRGIEGWYITTNLRVLYENNWLDDLKYICSPTEPHEKRYTMRFTCSRAIAQELTRHRVFSFLMESQRYINYSKERHGGEITFIAPASFPNMLEQYQNHFPDKLTQPEIALLECLRSTEHYYMHLLKDGYTPQQARDVLPNATKTELIMTGFSSDWRFLMDLRLFEKTGRVHPDMLDLMQKAQKAMQEAGIWEDIMSKPSKFD